MSSSNKNFPSSPPFSRWEKGFCAITAPVFFPPGGRGAEGEGSFFVTEEHTMSMHRREFLAALGSTALAGCSNLPTQTGNGDYRNLRVQRRLHAVCHMTSPTLPGASRNHFAGSVTLSTTSPLPIFPANAVIVSVRKACSSQSNS